MTSDFSLADLLDLTRSFTVKLKLIVRRKRQTTVHQNLRSIDLPEKKNDDDPTACGMGNASKKEGPNKAAPLRTFKVCAAYNSDKDAQIVEMLNVKKLMSAK
eukprot:898184-Amphidinium_carterae.1